MDKLLQCPNHRLTSTQILNFARALHEPHRSQLYAQTKEEGMPYEKFSKIAVDLVGFLQEANYCHYWKDMQKGGRWKKRTVVGSIKGKASLLVSFEGGVVEELAYEDIDYGLEDTRSNQMAEGTIRLLQPTREGDKEEEEAEEGVEAEDVAPTGVIEKVAITREVGVTVPRKVDVVPPLQEEEEGMDEIRWYKFGYGGGANGKDVLKGFEKGGSCLGETPPWKQPGKSPACSTAEDLLRAHLLLQTDGHLSAWRLLGVNLQHRQPFRSEVDGLVGELRPNLVDQVLPVSHVHQQASKQQHMAGGNPTGLSPLSSLYDQTGIDDGNGLFLWLFMHRASLCQDLQCPSIQAAISHLALVDEGVWRSSESNDEVAISLFLALQNRIERALVGLSYVRFGDFFVRCKPAAGVDLPPRGVLPPEMTEEDLSVLRYRRGCWSQPEHVLTSQCRSKVSGGGSIVELAKNPCTQVRLTRFAKKVVPPCVDKQVPLLDPVVRRRRIRRGAIRVLVAKLGVGLVAADEAAPQVVVDLEG
ncbi:hypothetical protein CBR_g38302 [Chara braunii]|uniref:Mediator of RNA polymerase II transcription subunit 13 n=1 Tax=Chara braunii TaxID=69332 RepID=A0A388LPX5_CHABU|nr:hypothetical protein CBR_g38302 [Chara braunii]|eukprot:GBG84331.1 hypothetical protein CBR_g38302 [Chara braunii]